MAYSNEKRISLTTRWSIASGLRFELLWLLAVGVCSSPCLAKPFAYITNNQSLTVSVIDTATNTVVATIPVGFGPAGVAVTPNGSRVYLTHVGGPNFVSVIDTVTNTVVHRVFAGFLSTNPAATAALFNIPPRKRLSGESCHRRA